MSVFYAHVVGTLALVAPTWCVVVVETGKQIAVAHLHLGVIGRARVLQLILAIVESAARHQGPTNLGTLRAHVEARLASHAVLVLE